MEQQAINLVANILLVEDDDDLAELVQMHLKFQGHQVSRATNVADAKAQYQQQPFDLLILDRGLPGGDGLDICHYLRQQQDWSPVLMLTARDGEMDKVDGLEAGVDDYITKPFSVLEFQARVRNVLRRVSQTAEAKVADEVLDDAMDFGPLRIIPELHQVSLNDKDVTLTATEFTLLQFLATRPGRVYSKDELLDHVWNTSHSGYHHTVCSTINRLRSKLSLSDSDHHFIQTVWGVGYKFQPRH
ncbi:MULTISPECIES: response regulator transcription factor [Vibrio]|uniref:response regulator transcription factor n=1 Tax=Vibrio TaxID=662 RepID=UPI00215F79D1|nr:MULTISPECIES: response regulator transcription factor [Vibrio]MCS0231272.1 response regulator transcription factor [Vibrio alginolyticus]MCS0276384.1 response regulator transcription factor [Vibrio alginolyticus]MDW1662876.1 response regulator transcription factor [Vibrio sp. Vb2656]MDW1700041.1 response regulator transcription factor [Vibrio sp. Vb2657]